MVFPNVDSEVKAVASVVAWPWELEHQQQLLLGPLLMSEGDPAVLFSSALLCVSVCVCVCVSHSVVLVTHLCPSLWHPMDCSLPDFSVCEILQARILEYIYSMDLPDPGIIPGSPALQADSLLCEPRGKLLTKNALLVWLDFPSGFNPLSIF